MPKIVDHAARRAEIADALYRVVARNGIDGASVRAVAAEAGWSMGAVRYYFGTQTELLQFGIQLQIERIPQRIQQIRARLAPGERRAREVFETLLALDDERLVEARVWMAALARAHIDPQLDDVRRQGWHGEQLVCRGTVCELIAQPWPQDAHTPLAQRYEQEATRLHILLDGLTVLGTSYADQIPPDEMRRIAHRELRDIRKRLG